MLVSRSLVSENKVLCHPASVDSLSTSAGTEDHVSMGGWAARKALQVVKNVEYGTDVIMNIEQYRNTRESPENIRRTLHRFLSETKIVRRNKSILNCVSKF